VNEAEGRALVELVDQAFRGHLWPKLPSCKYCADSGLIGDIKCPACPGPKRRHPP
jgi:hypothetical protein